MFSALFLAIQQLADTRIRSVVVRAEQDDGHVAHALRQQPAPSPLAGSGRRRGGEAGAGQERFA